MSWCDSFIDCLPSWAILVLIAWSYYAYVVVLCIYTIAEENILKEILYLIVYHLLLVMYMWTYFKVMCTDIAVVPKEYKIPRGLYERLRITETEEEKNYLLLKFCQQEDVVVVTRNDEGYIRYCNKCKHIKPDRAHHCSTCRTCVLKMDHHCPWVNNCIGFSNYKFFVQLLCYAALYCIFYAGTTLEYFIGFMSEPTKDYNRLHIVIGFIVALGFGVLLLSFCCYHMSLISKNQTTLEAMKEPVFRDNNENLTFHIGTCQNFAEVFGDEKWFIPVDSKYGDGVHFPIRLMV